MATTFYTLVAYSPPTPLGLLPGEWMVQHRCSRCHQRVMPEHLVAHAQLHEAEQSGGEDFHS
jgi:hypothetical protein